MKLQCPRGMLSSAFQAVSGVVPTRTPKEILKKVKLQLTDGQATLIGTDQEVGVRFQLPEVQTDSAGEVLLPVQRAMAILREVQDDVIGIEVSGDAVWIRAGQSEFRLSSEDPAEFPDVPSFSEESVFVVPERDLKEGIQRTLFAADVESTRYALGGVLLDIASDSLTLAATDSRRLAVYRTACSSEGGPADLPEQPVIPSKAMSLIERSLGEGETGVRMAVRANDAIISAGLVTIYSRLVQGRFPRYQDVIPQESGVTVELVAGPFHSAVRQAMIVTNEESRGVDFSFDAGTLTLNSQAADVGTSTVQLPISYDGAKTVVTFDPKFVSDFLKVVDPASQVTLNLIDANSAAVFRTDEKYTYVVMPLQRD